MRDIVGGVDLNCALSFTTASCHVNILQQAPLSEFQWLNLNTTYGSYESDLTFDLAHMSYEITGTGCTASGTNGEYRGSTLLRGLTVK